MSRQIAPSLVVTLGLLAVAAAGVLGQYSALFGMAAALVSANRNAWFLPVHVRPRAGQAPRGS